MEWVYSIFEDYAYITIRAIAVQLISLIALIIFVKSPSDTTRYAFVMVVATVGANIFNFVHTRRYVSLFNEKVKYEIKPHVIAISTVFATSLASQIYLNMDITMVGAIAGDYASGIYSASHKLVVTVTTLISSLRIILLPRLSYYLRDEGDSTAFTELNNKSSKILLCGCIPLMTGIFCLSDEAINIFCGSEFISASITLKILVFGMLFSTLNGFIVYQIFMPKKQERTALAGTVIGAIVNLLCNSILIPIYKHNGAAIGTVMAEMAVCIFCYIKSRKQINYNNILKAIIQFAIAALPIIIICICLEYVIENMLLRVFVSVSLGAFVYALMLYLEKNETFCEVALPFIKKICIRSAKH